MAWSPPDTAFPLRFPLVVFFFCAAACDAKAKGCDWKSVKTNHRAAAVTFLRFLLRYVSCVDVATAFRVAPLMSLLILFFFFLSLVLLFSGYVPGLQYSSTTVSSSHFMIKYNLLLRRQGGMGCWRGDFWI